MADRNVRGVHGHGRPVDDGHPVDPIDSGVVDWVFDGRLLEQGYTPHDVNTTARVLSRYCPYCHAMPGGWCVSKVTGADLAHLDDQHIARRMLD